MKVLPSVEEIQAGNKQFGLCFSRLYIWLPGEYRRAALNQAIPAVRAGSRFFDIIRNFCRY
jgi:hypothetical protein